MKVPGEFDDDQEDLEEPPEPLVKDCYVCPDKPLPPEPPMSSNEVSEDEFEPEPLTEQTSNEIGTSEVYEQQSVIPEEPEMTSNNLGSSIQN